MINPQSLTLTEAYDPYLTEEKLMFIEFGYDKQLWNYPDANDLSWVHAFSFDHENVLCHVIIKDFPTLERAREQLFSMLWNGKLIIRCGGVTDVVTEEEYDISDNNSPLQFYDWLGGC